jgi:hypothetical protein
MSFKKSFHTALCYACKASQCSLYDGNRHNIDIEINLYITNGRFNMLAGFVFVMIGHLPTKLLRTYGVQGTVLHE